MRPRRFRIKKAGKPSERDRVGGREGGGPEYQDAIQRLATDICLGGYEQQSGQVGGD